VTAKEFLKGFLPGAGAEIDLPGRAEATPRVVLERKQGENDPTYPKWPGMVELGTLDINDRPLIENPDGSYSSELSFSIEEDGKEVLLPEVVGRKHIGQKAAIEHYRRTGEHLGKFKDAASADAYAQKLHEWGALGVPKKFAQEAASRLGPAPEPPIQWAGVEPQESLRARQAQVGMLTPGNIDLDSRTPVESPEGFIDTERPIAITHSTKGDEDYGKTFLIPTVIDGKVFSMSAAIRDFKKTGKHLGVFKSELAAEEYMDKLRFRQERFYGMKSLRPESVMKEYGWTGGQPE
jgi:hypothetical protein